MKTLKPLLILSAGFVLAANARAASEENLKLAREVIEITQMRKTFDAMIPQMQQMTAQAMAPTIEKLPADQRAKADDLQKKINEITIAAVQEMLGKVDELYADVYSAKELQAMKDFFVSPEGHSMLEKQPLLMQKMMPLVQGMQANLMPKVQALVQEFKTEAEAHTQAQPEQPAK